MCGRTCCTLSPDVIPQACTVVTGSKLPIWRDAPCGGTYEPSTNVPPTAYTPILFKDERAGIDEFIVQPMMWGLVPPWHRGTVASSHRLTTNNARLEGLSESKLYKPAIEHDRRCVVVCDAFYEWKKLKDASTGKVFLSMFSCLTGTYF